MIKYFINYYLMGLSLNNIYFFNFTYPLRCLRVPPEVRVPQVEFHCSRQSALHAGRPLPPGRFLVLISVRG
jgi:hypothetical protein